MVADWQKIDFNAEVLKPPPCGIATDQKDELLRLWLSASFLARRHRRR